MARGGTAVVAGPCVASVAGAASDCNSRVSIAVPPGSNRSAVCTQFYNVENGARLACAATASWATTATCTRSMQRCDSLEADVRGEVRRRCAHCQRMASLVAEAQQGGGSRSLPRGVAAALSTTRWRRFESSDGHAPALCADRRSSGSLKEACWPLDTAFAGAEQYIILLWKWRNYESYPWRANASAEDGGSISKTG